MRWCDSGIAYDSPEGVEFGRKVMAFLDVESKRESERLAHERGAFPEWARSIWGPDDTCARDAAGQRIRPMQLLRNCNTTTVAPTGTISIIAGCSSGLEPLFAVAFMRNQAGVMMPDVNEDFVAVAKREGWYSDAAHGADRQRRTHRFPRGAVQVAACLRDRQRHQAGMAHADAGRIPGALRQRDLARRPISRTRRRSADVRSIYELAYQLKCKGVTVYRDGSRDNQVLSTGATEKAKAEREKGGAPAPAASAEDKREIGELHGALAERDAEIDRLKNASVRSRGGEPSAARKARPPGQAPRDDGALRDAARHDVRQHHRRRSRAAIRSLHQPRQGRWIRDGRCRSHGPAHLARACARGSR